MEEAFDVKKEFMSEAEVMGADIGVTNLDPVEADREIFERIDHTPLDRMDFAISPKVGESQEQAALGKVNISLTEGLGLASQEAVVVREMINPTYVSDGRMCDDYGDSSYQQPSLRDPDGASWNYYDNDNAEYGPYTGAMIKQWFDQGFFQGLGDRARVRRTSWVHPELIVVAYDDLLINLFDPKCNQPLLYATSSAWGRVCSVRGHKDPACYYDQGWPDGVGSAGGLSVDVALS